MFERYTQKARRVMFFARYEASQYGSPYIESECLLLGVLREDLALVTRFLDRIVSRQIFAPKSRGGSLLVSASRLP
jgi:hypothetical protein